MSMQSVDNFESSSSTTTTTTTITPVFGNTVSQTKIQQQQPNNDEVDKLETSSQSVINGENIKTNDHEGSITTESVRENNDTNNITDVHVNGQNEKTTVDELQPIDARIKDRVKPTEEIISTSEVPQPMEKTSQNEAIPESSNEQTDNLTSTVPPSPPPVDVPVSTEPKPALSTSTDVVKEDVSSTSATTNVDNVPPVETTSNENIPTSVTVPEATPERKTKSPRGKAKTPVVSTPPTRHSTRARKPVSSTNEEEEEEEEQQQQTTEDILVSKPSQKTLSPSPKRTKRQATTKDTTQPTSTSGTSLTEEVKPRNDQEDVGSDIELKDENIIESGKTQKKTPSPRVTSRTSTKTGKKREASSSPPPTSASKKKKSTPRGKKSTNNDDDDDDNEQMDVGIRKGNETTTTNASDTIQTPPKKTRTSGNRKTPTSKTPESSEEYLRKLRPRK